MTTGQGIKGKLRCALLLSVGLLALGGCAHAPEKLLKSNAGTGKEVEAEDVDSWAPFNHAMYKFNYGLDMLILKPVTKGYRAVVPKQGRKMVSNVIDNLYSPVVFTNSLLQGDPQNSFATLWRFLLNSTFGLGGTMDFASKAGLKNRPADFGQTLAMAGAGTGPYIVLPFFGPSNGRDALGRVVDAFLDPLNYAGYEVTIPKQAITAIDWRSRNGKVVDDIYENSLDPYETFRSAYTQKRASDIRRAQESREKALERSGGRQ
jgi:phospholipid-binding lipoprotein MlaA